MLDHPDAIATCKGETSTLKILFLSLNSIQKACSNKNFEIPVSYKQAG